MQGEILRDWGTEQDYLDGKVSGEKGWRVGGHQEEAGLDH